MALQNSAAHATQNSSTGEHQHSSGASDGRLLRVNHRFWTRMIVGRRGGTLLRSPRSPSSFSTLPRFAASAPQWPKFPRLRLLPHRVIFVFCLINAEIPQARHAGVQRLEEMRLRNEEEGCAPHFARRGGIYRNQFLHSSTRSKGSYQRNFGIREMASLNSLGRNVPWASRAEMATISRTMLRPSNCRRAQEGRRFVDDSLRPPRLSSASSTGAADAPFFRQPLR